MAIELGATFVARSFSGDKAQLVPLIKAAFQHRGAAFIDVISPCVTFNNHEGSTKSYDYVREHNIAVNSLDFINGREPIEIDYAEGAAQAVTLHDGSTILLRKLDAEHDFSDRVEALTMLENCRETGEISDRAPLPRQGRRRAARHARHDDPPAERARPKPTLPRLEGARGDQPLAAVGGRRPEPRLPAANPRIAYRCVKPSQPRAETQAVPSVSGRASASRPAQATAARR